VKYFEALILSRRLSGCIDESVLPATTCRLFLEQAHRDVQTECTQRSRYVFQREDYATYPASAPFLNLDVALNTTSTGALMRLEAVGYMPNGGHRSQSNEPMVIRRLQDAGAVPPGKGPMVFDYDIPGAPLEYVGGSGVDNFLFELFNHELRLHPIPASDVNLYLITVRELKFSEEDDMVLGGFVAGGEMAVVYHAADLMASAANKDEYAARARAQYMQQEQRLTDRLKIGQKNLGPYSGMNPYYPPSW